MARPRKEIDQKQFEELCKIQCTEEEICAVLGVTDKTLNAWCKRTYKKGFSEISAEKRKGGRTSLRRAGFELAKKNAAVHIFYAKNYLGMSDVMHQEVEIGSDGLIDALTAKAAEDWSDGADD
jgi:hypothetical protein